jgi:hypothetical protein
VKITFNFAAGVAHAPDKQTATAACDLSGEQYALLDRLRETARSRKLQYVEGYAPVQQWTCSSRGYEPAEVIVDPILGLSMIARSDEKDSTPLKSAWIDWGTLDLTWVLENDFAGTLDQKQDEGHENHELQSV